MVNGQDRDITFSRSMPNEPNGTRIPHPVREDVECAGILQRRYGMSRCHDVLTVVNIERESRGLASTVPDAEYAVNDI